MAVQHCARLAIELPRPSAAAELHEHWHGQVRGESAGGMYGEDGPSSWGPARNRAIAPKDGCGGPMDFRSFSESMAWSSEERRVKVALKWQRKG